MKKTKKISVGISAYNEERNIANVLKDILAQHQKYWQLQEIFVFSDGSSDQTVNKARSIKNSLIKVVDHQQRKGKTARIQELFSAATGDIIIMFDADVRIPSRNVISNLVKAFDKNERIKLVGGNTKPYSPTDFFQRGVYATFKVFYQSRININSGKNLFACTGGCLAIRKDFFKEVTFPKIKNQDTYLYFLCIKKGYQFVFVKNAIVYYKLPKTLSDYLAQVFRSNPEAVELNLKKYFGKLVHDEYQRGSIFYLKNVFRVLADNPLPTLFIILINILCKPFFRFLSKSSQVSWNSVKSTK